MLVSDIFNLLNIFPCEFYKPIRQNVCNCNCLRFDVIAFFNCFWSLGLLIIAFSTRKDWQKKFKGEKLEDAKRNLVYFIIDFVSTLRMHCYEDLTVSQLSELKFETRDKYIRRYFAIKNAVDSLSKKYPNIYPIEISYVDIERNADGYISHMSDSTVFVYAKIIEKLNVKNLKMKRKA